MMAYRSRLSSHIRRRLILEKVEQNSDRVERVTEEHWSDTRLFHVSFPAVSAHYITAQTMTIQDNDSTSSDTINGVAITVSSFS
jgi:hypothetical protein